MELVNFRKAEKIQLEIKSKQEKLSIWKDSKDPMTSKFNFKTRQGGEGFIEIINDKFFFKIRQFWIDELEIELIALENEFKQL